MGWVASMHLVYSPGFMFVGGFYLAVVAGGLLASIHWQRRFNMQLSLQVFADIVAIGLLMHAGGGVASGIGTLLLVSLATASLVGRGRLVLLYAALATLATLVVQTYGMAFGGLDAASIVQAGLLSAGFFATAIVARLLGQRVMVNEELARQRGITLENQGRISQRVIERMQDGVLVIDAAGCVQRHNPVAATCSGRRWHRRSHCPPAARRWRPDWPAGRTPVRPATWISRRRRAAKFRARFEGTASSTGEVLIFLEDLGRLQERARQLKLAALGRFTASIAHEIRNPLSAIGHAGELLREERRGAMQDRLLKILADNVARLDRIVADILELGRRDRMQLEPLPLAAFCEHFLDSFASSQGLAAGVVVLQIADDLRIYFDRNHLHQILWNLLRNAVRHCSGRPGSVSLRAGPAAADGAGRSTRHRRWRRRAGGRSARRSSNRSSPPITRAPGSACLSPANCARLTAPAWNWPPRRGAAFHSCREKRLCQLPEANVARAAN